MKRSDLYLITFALTAVLFVGLGQAIIPTRAEKLNFSVEAPRTNNLQDSSSFQETNNIAIPKSNNLRLEKLLGEQEIKGWWLFNLLKIGIKQAVDKGVSADTIVLILLFPITATLVAFSRNIIGVTGFGIFIPAAVSVAFLSTGAVAGIVLLSIILAAATLGRILLKGTKLPYLPRMGVLILIVSLALLGLLMSSPFIKLESLVKTNIFPIMLFILLAETFIDAQITRTAKTAIVMMIETIILALAAYSLMSSRLIQGLVILHPEMTVCLLLLTNYLIGRYKGLRLLEVWKFRQLLKS